MEKFLEAGRVVATHGVKGELRVEPWCDSAEFIRPLKRFYRKDGTVMAVQSSRVHKSFLLVKFEGIDTATDGDALRGAVLFLNRDDVKLPKGRYFVADLIGLRVVDADTAKTYGTIAEVFETGANSVYRIRGEEEKEYLFPAVESMIVSTDIAAGTVQVRPIRGIFDDAD